MILQVIFFWKKAYLNCQTVDLRVIPRCPATKTRVVISLVVFSVIWDLISLSPRIFNPKVVSEGEAQVRDDLQFLLGS